MTTLKRQLESHNILFYIQISYLDLDHLLGKGITTHLSMPHLVHHPEASKNISDFSLGRCDRDVGDEDGAPPVAPLVLAAAVPVAASDGEPTAGAGLPRHRLGTRLRSML